MSEAGAEEKILAIERGSYIPAITDGGWSKRSYNAIIVGKSTGRSKK